MLGAPHAWSQEPLDYDAARAGAVKAFFEGRLHEGIPLFHAAITAAPDEKARLATQRDLLELCGEAYAWDCVGSTINAMLPAIQKDPTLNFYYPDILLYELRSNRASHNDEYIRNILAKGASGILMNPAANPAAYALYQMELLAWEVRQTPFTSAEARISSAIGALLLIDPKQTYAISKVLLGLTQGLYAIRDVAGAFALATMAENYFARNVPIKSALYAEFKFHVGLLLSHTNAYPNAAAVFAEVDQLQSNLQVNPWAIAYRRSVSNNLQVIAELLSGRHDDAKRTHQRHIIQPSREALLAKGEFQNIMEFYFGVVDVFLAAVTGSQLDERWRVLFEKPATWFTFELGLEDLESYRLFALGFLSLPTDKQLGIRLLADAARKRVHVFSALMSATKEGFILPDFLDRTVIGIGLTNALAAGGPDATDLLLQGSEVNSRNYRHQLVDAAAWLATQKDDQTRREAHSFVNLITSKRQWEFKQIGDLLGGTVSPNTRAEANLFYPSLTDQVTVLKERLASRQKGAGIPHVADIQKALGPKEAFVTSFEILGMHLGKLCVTATQTTYAATPFSPQTFADIKALSEAISVAPVSADAVHQFPAEESHRLYKLLFEGLDDCLAGATLVNVVTPTELSAVPLAALLRSVPPKMGGGYDLVSADWAVRHHSFASIVSARHFIAVRATRSARPAPKPYLGVGNPTINKAILASNQAVTRALRGQNFEFQELPETETEIRAVAKIFGARETDLLLGANGTEERFRSKLLSDYDVVHFATHGLLKGEVEGLADSALVLSPKSTTDTSDDGLLSASEIASLSLTARLIVLSACNTARFDTTQANRSVQDLQAAFTVAGAPAMVGSLWPVASDAAEDLITRFFKQWRVQPTLGAAEALTAAIRGYLASADFYHRHPFYWAPFVVVGNGAAIANTDGPSTDHGPSPEPLDAYQSGGEVLHAERLGNDLLYSMIAEYDGQHMNQILVRRSVDGRNRWLRSSRDVGIDRVRALSHTIFVSGYLPTREAYPIIQAFAPNGMRRGIQHYKDLKFYTFSDFLAHRNGLVAMAYPSLMSAPEYQAQLLDIALDGQVRRRLVFPLPYPRGLVIGRVGLLALSDTHVYVALNRGTKTTPKFNAFGYVKSCYEGSATDLFQIDRTTWKVTGHQVIDGFTTRVMQATRNAILIGGEDVIGCDGHTRAALYTVRSMDKADIVWRDDDAFPTSVEDFALEKSSLLVLVRHKRLLGMQSFIPYSENINTDKRAGLDAAVRQEASLVTLSSDGAMVRRNYYAAGYNLHMRGVLSVKGTTIIYGMLGGIPSISR